MTWYAKPKGSYGYTSTEGKANVFEMSAYLQFKGFTYESQSGIIGNSVAESGLNPWRWQGDTYNLSGGYGLFQYTPASGYIDGCANLDYYAPNLSVTEITTGADPTDGIAQLIAFADNVLGKWSSTCWRSYWDTETYADLYQVRSRILEVYGDGSRLTLEQFKNITNVYHATFAFLACFEGPAVPNMEPRYDYASDIYKLLTGRVPDVPSGKTRTKKSIFLNSKFAVLHRRVL